jgi:hypothetical protein
MRKLKCIFQFKGTDKGIVFYDTADSSMDEIRVKAVDQLLKLFPEMKDETVEGEIEWM